MTVLWRRQLEFMNSVWIFCVLVVADTRATSSIVVAFWYFVTVFFLHFFSWGIQRRRYINVNFWRQNLAHSTCNKHKIMKNIEFLLSYGYICLLFIKNVFKNKNRKFVSPLVVFCRLLSFVFCQREIDSDWSKI